MEGQRPKAATAVANRGHVFKPTRYATFIISFSRVISRVISAQIDSSEK